MSNHHRTVPAWRLAFLFAIAWIAIALAPGRALAQEPALDLPVVVQGAGVVVRAEAGLDELARQAAERVPAHLARVSADLEGLPVPGPIELRLVKRAEDLGRAAPPMRGAPEWARGVAYPELGIAIVATRRGHEPIDALRVIDHEVTHLALGTALRGRAPRWLDEGFAFVHAADDSPARTQLLVGMAWTGNTATLSDLEQMFRGSEATVDRAYAQSYDLVAFLARRGRYPDKHDDGERWPFQRFLAAIAAGETPHEAARTAYGVPLSDLFGEWHEDLRQRYLMIPASLFMLGLWVLAAILLVLGAARRRSTNRSILDRWEQEEMARRFMTVAMPWSTWSPGGSSSPLVSTGSNAPAAEPPDTDGTRH
ncbi:MAG TPA: hypothetical protein VNM90_12150 [Haliangium sp.]|nr:hypothetical protein [Haliangium sp.]